MKYIYPLFLLPIFTSCSNGSYLKFGIVGVVGLFAAMFILFALMFYLIAKRKKKGEKSLAKFNNDIHIALNKLDTPQQKINMLNNLIERINNDEKYAKDTEWRDKVLLKTYMHLATVYFHAGEELETLRACSKIIELDPNDGMSYYNRGSIYSNRGMSEKALHDLDKAIELMPDYASAYNNRGLVHEKLRHYNEALIDFAKAIELEGSPIAYYNRGNTYYEQEDYNNALNDYDSALERSGDDTNLKNEITASIEAVKESKK